MCRYKLLSYWSKFRFWLIFNCLTWWEKETFKLGTSLIVIYGTNWGQNFIWRPRFTYTRVQNVCPGWKTAGNQGNHQNFDPTLLAKKLWPFNMRMKQILFSKWQPKKSYFFKIANSRNFFAKISEIGPWVSRIEWCKGHRCSSTCVAVRLSDKSPKTAKKYRKCIFWLFLSFCQTASPPYTLSYIDALGII